jgi:ribosome biogenesis GTPase
LSRDSALADGLVVSAHGRHYLIETPDGKRHHVRPRGKKSECVVGDRVRWLATGKAEGVIEHVEPRINVLTRQDEWRTKSFAANVDQLLVIVAGEPMFGDSQLARALIAAGSADIPALIGLNKIDLPQAESARERLLAYRAMGIKVVELSIKADPTAARRSLLPLLQGCKTLLLGPSGAGKSTLINLIVPDAGAQVGEISRALKSGRHTTTTAQWYWLDAERRSALIDTPGFQEFGLQHIDAANLALLMPDLRAHVAQCRFYNCTHRQEPGCGVAAACARGEIAPSRWRIYREIYEELTAARF